MAGEAILVTVRQMMRAFIDGARFDRVLGKLHAVSASPGHLVCEMGVEKEHTNRGGTMHGGLTALLVDSVSSLALFTTKDGRPGVSVDMNITYMNAAQEGETVMITADVLKQGRTLAFTSVNIMNKDTGRLIAQGRHTKHLGS